MLWIVFVTEGFVAHEELVVRTLARSALFPGLLFFSHGANCALRLDRTLWPTFPRVTPSRALRSSSRGALRYAQESNAGGCDFLCA